MYRIHKVRHVWLVFTSWLLVSLSSQRFIVNQVSDLVACLAAACDLYGVM